eukprot:5393381-Ditylum_brightwellii.AAC.1
MSSLSTIKFSCDMRCQHQGGRVVQYSEKEVGGVAGSGERWCWRYVEHLVWEMEISRSVMGMSGAGGLQRCPMGSKCIHRLVE